MTGTSSGPVIAVVGATGAVGAAIVKILEERRVPMSHLRLMASARSGGRLLSTPWGRIEVEDLEHSDPAGVDIALFSAGADRSRKYAATFVDAGAVVIDNSSAFRMDDDVPLVVADVNDHAISGHTGLVANPNCTTMTLMMAVAPLHWAAGLKQMTVTSYQSVSGSGKKGMDVLAHEIELLGKDAEALVTGDWTDPGGELYSRPIAYNVLPHAGSFADAGYTDEEWKLVNETRKILEAPKVKIEPTCVRVPVMVGHGVAATMHFDRPLSSAEATELLRGGAGVEVWDDGTVPTPLDSAGRDTVLVGRVRDTLGDEGGVSLWAVGDNLRKGAALNAVQLAELVLN